MSLLNGKASARSKRPGSGQKPQKTPKEDVNSNLEKGWLIDPEEISCAHHVLRTIRPGPGCRAVRVPVCFHEQQIVWVVLVASLWRRTGPGERDPAASFGADLL